MKKFIKGLANCLFAFACGFVLDMLSGQYGFFVLGALFAGIFYSFIESYFSIPNLKPEFKKRRLDPAFVKVCSEYTEGPLKADNHSSL